MIIPVTVEYTSSLLKLNSNNKVTAQVPEQGFFIRQAEVSSVTEKIF